MLLRRSQPVDTVSDERMAEMFGLHVAHVEAWLARQPNIDVIYVSYNDVMADPRPDAERISRFLGDSLDVEEMLRVADGTLYRQKG